MILDTQGIQQILPHRYPFLMVDAILEIEPFKRIVGIKNVSINEGIFQGHFPGKAIFPGVLIIESMAQTGGLLLLRARQGSRHGQYRQDKRRDSPSHITLPVACESSNDLLVVQSYYKMVSQSILNAVVSVDCEICHKL